jgi:serine/threonine-protein kinase HipA
MIQERKIYVYIYLNGKPKPVGLLKCLFENGQVVESHFRYGQKYLQHPDRVSIDLNQLPLVDEELITEKNFDLFSGIKDAAPDAWGRALLDKRANRPLREDEVLLATSDYRVGSLAFGLTLDGPKRVTEWASEQDSDLVDLNTIFTRFLDYTSNNLAKHEEAMKKFIIQGSSMGGARPKATCTYDGDSLWLAKFSQINDAFDFVRSEYAVMTLAKTCGLNVPQVAVESLQGRSIFLIERFDRHKSQRFHFQSFLTILGVHELSFRHSSYMDMAFAIQKYSTHDLEDRKELYSRMIFNGLVGNNDDHLRNHAMIWKNRKSGFRLSPLYDVVPNPRFVESRRLAIHCGYKANGDLTHEFDEECVIRAHQDFGLSESEARAIFADLKNIVTSQWRDHFIRAGFRRDELSVFAPLFA